MVFKPSLQPCELVRSSECFLCRPWHQNVAHELGMSDELSLSDFANRLDVSKSYLSRYSLILNNINRSMKLQNFHLEQTPSSKDTPRAEDDDLETQR